MAAQEAEDRRSWLVGWLMFVGYIAFFLRLGSAGCTYRAKTPWFLQHWHLFDKWFDQWDSQALIGKVFFDDFILGFPFLGSSGMEQLLK